MTTAIDTDRPTVRVTCNRVPRLIIDDYQLTPAERKDFDYLDWTAIDGGTESASFVRYKGTLYDLGEVQVAPHVLKAKGFDGYVPLAYYFGVCFMYFDTDGREIDGGDRVIVGCYIAEG